MVTNMKRMICAVIASLVLFSISTDSLAYANSSDLVIQSIIQDQTTDYPLDMALDALDQKYQDYYGDGSEYEKAKRFIEIYRSDVMFQMHYQADPQGAIEMVMSVISDVLSLVPVQQSADTGTRAREYSVSGVPFHQQVRTNSCGAASALQVIVQQGGEDNIAGSSYDEKEETLISETQLGAGVESSVLVYEVVDLINDYISSGSEFKYIACDSLTESEFKDFVRDSFINDCPVILHAIKGYLDYYPSSDMNGHYIVGIAWRPPLDEFQVNDCNWRDEYAGVHTVSMTSAYESVHEYHKTRYLIYGE